MKTKTHGNRILALLLAAVLLVGALAGCAPKQPAQTDDAGKNAQTQTDESNTAGGSELEPVELTWYFMGNYPQEGQDEVFAAANKIIKEKINATVNFVPIAFGDYDQKMQVVIASGEEFDLCFTSDWTNNYVQNVSKGAFLPLDDLIAEYAPNAAAAIPEKMWDATRVNGQIYGFINQQISARTPVVETPVRLYDKYHDVLDIKSYEGKLYASNLSELEPYIKAVIDNEGSDYYFQSGLYNLEGSFFGMEYVSSWSIPGAIELDGDGLKVVNQFKNENMLTYAELMRDWNSKGYLDSQRRIATKTDDAVAGQTESRTAIYIGATYKPGIEVQDSVNSEPIIAMPAGQALMTTSAIIADLQAISSTSKNPERAMMLIELVNTDAELFNTLISGIEGKNWNFNEEGFLEKTDPPYAPNSDWMFGTNFLAYPQVGQTMDVWDQTRAINENATPSPLLGFSFNPEPVKSEISQCAAVVDEYSRGIELGVYDAAKYEEFLNKLDAAGADIIIAEMQNQIDAWSAAK